MLRLRGALRELSAKETAILVNTLTKAMKILIYSNETIGICADLSINGVLLLLASMKAGTSIALCPLREPVLVMGEWLQSLGIKRVICADRSMFSLFPKSACFAVDELVANTSLENDAEFELHKDFSSIVRTSGTTSSPKNALIRGHAHKASAIAVNHAFSVNTKSFWLLHLPLYHVSGLSILFRALSAKASLFIAMNLEDAYAALREHPLTHLSLVPLQLRRLLEMEAHLLRAKTVIVGGDVLPESLKIRAHQLGLLVYETYGLTETAAMVWAQECMHDKRGFVLPHAQMELGEDQEILVGGQSLFSGYLTKDGLSHELDHRGLFRTGDLSDDLSAMNTPLVRGRKSNRIITAGQNVQAEEIERVLLTHPLIEESVVVPVSHIDFGMTPCVFIKWRKDPLDLDALKSYLSLRLATYKIPKIFLPWPKNTPLGIKKPRAWLANSVSEYKMDPY